MKTFHYIGIFALVIFSFSIVRGGAIIIPAEKDLLPVQEGTLEIWFKPGADINAEPEEDFYSPFSLLALYNNRGGKEKEPLIMYRVQKSKMKQEDPSSSLLADAGIIKKYNRDLYIRFGEKVIVLGENRLNQLKWAADQPQYLALTWNTVDEVVSFSIYLNGEEILGLRDVPQAVAQFSERNGYFVIGSRNSKSITSLTVSAIRFSSRVSSLEDIIEQKKHDPKQNESTTFIETFSTIPLEQQGEYLLNSGAKLSGDYWVVRDSRGKSIQLFNKK